MSERMQGFEIRSQIVEQKKMFWDLVDEVASLYHYKGRKRIRYPNNSRYIGGRNDDHRSGIELVEERWEDKTPHYRNYHTAIRIYGVRDCYYITFSAYGAPDRDPPVGTFVCCSCGVDLTDGPLTPGTWIRVLSAIVACEMDEPDAATVSTNSRQGISPIITGLSEETLNSMGWKTLKKETHETPVLE